MQKINKWHQFETAAQVAETICEQIIQIANQAISETGQFKIVLAGGSSPEKSINYWSMQKLIGQNG